MLEDVSDLGMEIYFTKWKFLNIFLAPSTNKFYTIFGIIQV